RADPGARCGAFLEMRGRERSAERLAVGVPHVIDHHDEEVGPVLGTGRHIPIVPTIQWRRSGMSAPMGVSRSSASRLIALAAPMSRTRPSVLTRETKTTARGT